jgi:uncharacterized membrane protein
MCMRMMRHMNSETHSETPLQILKRRFAPGEITKDQYEEMRNVLLDEREGSHNH